MKQKLRLVSHNLRNFFNFNPLIYNLPHRKNAPVSDFFYFRQDNSFSTLFYLSNISSHIFPEIKQSDYVKVFLYSNIGKRIKELEFNLAPFETIKLNFKDFNINEEFGSFCIFHHLEKKELLSQKNTHITERGYTGFSKDLNFWNFVHGNHNSLYLDNKKIVKSLMPKSLFKKTYYPQLTFNQSDYFEIVVNNPSYKKILYELYLKDENNNIIDIINESLDSFCTTFIPIKNNNKKIKFIEVKSNFYFSRPLIFKFYGEYFDVLHG